jgi:hypothetical protein
VKERKKERKRKREKEKRDVDRTQRSEMMTSNCDYLSTEKSS